MSPKRDWASLSGLEWLETNGLGGYALGTVAGAGTRGYHGLLVAAERAPGVRTMIVTTGDEWLVQDPAVGRSDGQTVERPRFSHGGETDLPNGTSLISSYHPSRQNTNTRKLTRPMWHGIFRRARELLDG